ncbi:MAG TPA: SCP2 sterol-binding domain-containing protein [Gammaproteobacteria bacterium]|nr:SCP2 sterol-binding domain-containing protein [Gammaproteobacteria bacterium]
MSAAGEIELALAELLERAVNGYLALDPVTLERLDGLTGRVIAIEPVGLSQRLFVIPHGEGVQVMTHYAGTPDTVLRGTPLALARLSLSKGDSADASARVLFSGDVVIEGDVELGQRFKRILDAVDVDWEELVARVSGDALAHRLGRLARELQTWGGQASEHLGRDLAEYLQYESADLIDRREVKDFVADVDTLRDDTERLDARVQRLRRRLESKGQ